MLVLTVCQEADCTGQICEGRIQPDKIIPPSGAIRPDRPAPGKLPHDRCAAIEADRVVPYLYTSDFNKNTLMTSFAFRAGLFLADRLPIPLLQPTATPAPRIAGIAAFNKDTLAADIRILASDDFQGRRPLRRARQKRSITWLMPIPASDSNQATATAIRKMSRWWRSAPPPRRTWKCTHLRAIVHLQNLTDFVRWTERPDSIDMVDKSDIVFAGFGIVAPEYNWNDYAGLDVKGKTVLVMVNDPGFYDSTLFKGHTMTYYGRWTYKYEEAARQGAKACLIIHNTAAASYPFSVVQSSNGGVKLHLDTRSNPSYQLTVQGWITEETGKEFARSRRKGQQPAETGTHPGFKAVPLDLNCPASST